MSSTARHCFNSLLLYLSPNRPQEEKNYTLWCSEVITRAVTDFKHDHFKNLNINSFMHQRERTYDFHSGTFIYNLQLCKWIMDSTHGHLSNTQSIRGSSFWHKMTRNLNQDSKQNQNFTMSYPLEACKITLHLPRMHPHQNGILQKPHSRTSQDQRSPAIACTQNLRCMGNEITHPKRQFCKRLSQDCEN